MVIASFANFDQYAVFVLSASLSDGFRKILTIVDQVCLFIFIAELLFKAVVYNKDFFGEKRVDGYGDEYFHINRWNISNLLIVLVSSFSILPYFAVFRTFRVLRSLKIIKAIRSFRIVKSFKLVNEVSSLRTIFKGLLKAIPGIIATFSFLAIFAYAYAIIGTNIFSEEFPQFFGTLGTSILTLCQVTTFDSWFSGIARPITQVYPWAWIYFVSYAFIAASVIMNAIVGIFVDSVVHEDLPEFHEGCRVWNLFRQEIYPTELSEGIAVVHGVLNTLVRQGEPRLKEVHSKHLLDSHRRTPTPSFGVIRLYFGAPSPPRYY